jgi:hypothetical protein
MRASRIAWNSNGTVLAVSGTLPGTSDGKGGPEAKETPAVQFYSNQGKHVKRTPGHEVVDTRFRAKQTLKVCAFASLLFAA